MKIQKLIFVFLLLPILVGCDAGFNIRTGKTKVAEARECYEATRAGAEVIQLEIESARKGLPTEHYKAALLTGSHWYTIACKDIKF